MGRCPVEAARLVRDLLREKQAVRFTATGHSMTPALRHGDVLTVEPLPGAKVPIGSVVACDQDGRLVVHRLVRWDAGRAVCRGDAAPACDPSLLPGALLGVVTGAVRRGRLVRFGLGREGCLLAWLSRRGLLRALLRLRERARRNRIGLGHAWK